MIPSRYTLSNGNAQIRGRFVTNWSLISVPFGHNGTSIGLNCHNQQVSIAPSLKELGDLPWNFATTCGLFGDAGC